MTVVDERPAIASTKARAKIVLTLAELGVKDEEEQRNVVERTTRGRTRRRSELRPDEASWLIKRLETITPAEIAAIARPTGPAPRVEAEPAPAQLDRDPEACLASWDAPVDVTGSPPIPAPVEPAPRDTDDPPTRRFERRRPDPVAIAAADALAPLLAPAGQVDEQVDEQTDSVAAATQSVILGNDGKPVTPPVEEPRRNPTWPFPSAEGWTGPTMPNGQPNPSGTDRYCLPAPGTCYCGGCPHYVPIPPADSPEYRGQVARARREASEKNERRGRRR